MLEKKNIPLSSKKKTERFDRCPAGTLQYFIKKEIEDLDVILSSFPTLQSSMQDGTCSVLLTITHTAKMHTC